MIRFNENFKDYSSNLHHKMSKDDMFRDQLKEKNTMEVTNTVTDEKKVIEVQYQTVTVRKKTENCTISSMNNVEEILKKIVPAKSFLYRHQIGKIEGKIEKPVTSYMPMNAANVKKPKRFFRLSYDYPHFDLKHFRFSRTENFNDHGYYSVKTNTGEVVQKTYKKPEPRTKYKSLQTADEIEKISEDHFYEDLNYSDADKEPNDLKEANPSNNLRQYKSIIQELMNSFKLPFFKKPGETNDGEKSNEIEAKVDEDDSNKHIYENSDSLGNMYDSVNVGKNGNKAVESENQPNIPVEEYLEPVQVMKDYCDVEFKQKEESIFGYIMSLFESRFGTRRAETNDVHQSDDFQDIDEDRSEEIKISDETSKKTNMADRPLPVPIENEPYYMNIERNEAENLLRGTPDGTFLLRPSSQPDHAYTLSVSCSNAVHNVGVRRRRDGRLALGFARKGERGYACVTSLLRHHRKRRLLLITPSGLCATTLNESPQYYQTPCNLPIANIPSAS